MNAHRRTAILVGVLYIIGTVAGVLSIVVAGPMVGGPSHAEPDYLAKIAGQETQLIMGALFLLTMGLALAMIPAVAFPLLKGANEVLALGYVVFRGALETSITIGTAVCWLLLLPVAQGLAGGGVTSVSYYHSTGALVLEASSMLGAMLAIVFPLGALMFYALLYQSRLVPRWLSGWGLVAAIPYLGAGLLSLFGIVTSSSASYSILVVPMLVQEMVLAAWLIVKGFSPLALASRPPLQVELVAS